MGYSEKRVNLRRVVALEAIGLCMVVGNGVAAQPNGAASGGDTLRLSLREAVGMAMENNVGLKASQLNE